MDKGTKGSLFACSRMRVTKITHARILVRVFRGYHVFSVYLLRVCTARIANSLCPTAYSVGARARTRKHAPTACAIIAA